jgi:hypothetical protein
VQLTLPLFGHQSCKLAGALRPSGRPQCGSDKPIEPQTIERVELSD